MHENVVDYWIFWWVEIINLFRRAGRLGQDRPAGCQDVHGIVIIFDLLLIPVKLFCHLYKNWCGYEWKQTGHTIKNDNWFQIDDVLLNDLPEPFSDDDDEEKERGDSRSLTVWLTWCGLSCVRCVHGVQWSRRRFAKDCVLGSRFTQIDYLFVQYRPFSVRNGGKSSSEAVDRSNSENLSWSCPREMDPLLRSDKRFWKSPWKLWKT